MPYEAARVCQRDMQLAIPECIKSVRSVHFMEEFGAPEAIWELAVENFPAVVTIDAYGNSLHREVLAASRAALVKRL